MFYDLTVNNTIIEYKKINRDINGNPRYTIHFIDILKMLNKEIPYNIDKAIKLASKLSGLSKYKSKKEQGFLVIQSYNLQTDLEYIVSIN